MLIAVRSRSRSRRVLATKSSNGAGRWWMDRNGASAQCRRCSRRVRLGSRLRDSRSSWSCVVTPRAEWNDDGQEELRRSRAQSTKVRSTGGWMCGNTSNWGLRGGKSWMGVMEVLPLGFGWLSLALGGALLGQGRMVGRTVGARIVGAGPRCQGRTPHNPP